MLILSRENEKMPYCPTKVLAGKVHSLLIFDHFNNQNNITKIPVYSIMNQEVSIGNHKVL